MEITDESKRRLRNCASAEKREYLKTMLRLKHQENIFETELKAFVRNMRMNSAATQDLPRNLADISTARQKELAGPRKILREISNDLTLIRSTLATDIRKIDVDEYREKLVKLWQNIQSCKNSMSIQTLSEERISLESDVNELFVSIQKFNDLTSDTLRITDASSRQKENKKISIEDNGIQDFHALIAKTGHTQNWSDEDHSLFVKLRKKCNNVPAVITAIRNKCPDLSVEAIVEHEAWYKTYLDLREKQRNAVSEWRVRKKLEKITDVRGSEKNSEKLVDPRTILQKEKICGSA